MNNFDTIIGYETEKKELMRLCDVMKNKEKYCALGVQMPKALLIYGEPGLGKTLMANTLISASERKCFSCKKDRSDGAFIDKIRETFESAAKNQPSIVFLDDMDKFAQDNLKENSNKEEFVIIQSCFEDLKDKDVFVIATANNIRYIPDSLLREGRFGKQMKIEMPCKEDSINIIKHFLKNKTIDKDVSVEFVANLLEGKSCAFLESLVNEAGIYAGFENQSKINKNHLLTAVMRLTTKHLPSKKMSDKERRIVCYHEAGHAVASILLGKKIGLITSKKHGDIGGFCSTYEQEKENHTFEEFKNEVIILLSGKASTEIIYGVPDLGVESDVKMASNLTKYCLESLATNGFYYIYDFPTFMEKQPIKRIESITDKVSEILTNLYNESLTLLKNNKPLLEKIASALFEKEVLVWEDICNLSKKITT